MASGDILSDFGINLLEEEIDDVIFQTNEFLTDATFTGSQGPFWWILQMCMALAALFAIVMAAGMAYKMMVKNEPLDIMKLFKPLAISIILCWWYPPADTGMVNSGSNWCVLDFLSYIPNCIGSYTHDLYQAEATQIEDKFQEVQQLIYARDTMYTSLQAQADVAHSGTSDPNLIEATMEQTGVDEVTNMEKDAAKLWFTSLTSGIVVGIDKIVMLIALIVFRIGWWATIYCQQILLGMLTIFGPILQQRTVKDGLLRSSHFSHSCRMLSNQCFQHYIFEQYIHVGMDFTTVLIGFAFQFLRALANGIHVPFKDFKLLVSRP